jgi:hypothetical protein
MVTKVDISHKDTKHTDKCSNNKTKTQKQNDETIDNFFSKCCKDNTQKKFDIKCTHIVQSAPEIPNGF